MGSNTFFLIANGEGLELYLHKKVGYITANALSRLLYSASSKTVNLVELSVFVQWIEPAYADVD